MKCTDACTCKKCENATCGEEDGSEDERDGTGDIEESDNSDASDKE